MNNALQANPYLQQAAYTVAAGGVIAYPTEAVWGLGCDPFNEDAVHHILKLKRRPVHKGVILVAGSLDQVAFLLEDLPTHAIAQLNQTWPGPHTWLLPHNNRVPPTIHGAFDTVAVRVSEHPVIQSLCAKVGGPIVSTSANPQGKEPAKTQWRARCYFGHAVTYCPGTIGKAQAPSTIKNLMTGEIIRSA